MPPVIIDSQSSYCTEDTSCSQINSCIETSKNSERDREDLYELALIGYFKASL